MIKELLAALGVGIGAYVGYDKWKTGTWIWEKPPFVNTTQQMQKMQLINVISQQQRMISALQQQQKLQEQKAQPVGRYGNPSQPGHTANWGRGSGVY